jgi:hypothetical protein
MLRGLFMSVVIVTALGCQRSPTGATAGTAPRTVEDYRKLTLSELRSFIQTKLQVDGIDIQPDGANRYKGTIPTPDGTRRLPLEVIVEGQRILLVTKTPAGSTSQIITPRGLEAGPLDIK